MTAEIRYAKAQDCAALAALDTLCSSAPWSEKQFSDELTLPHARLLVAVLGGELAGFCDMHIVADDAHINELGVLPNFRRKGIGRALVEYAVRVCEKERCAVLSLEVRSGNREAVPLYESVGFETVGRRRGFYRDSADDALIMNKYLKEEKC